MTSIDWKKRAILINFQKAESQSSVSNINLKYKILDALSSSDSDWELEWEYIQRYLTARESIIIRYTLEGYTLSYMSNKLKLHTSTICTIRKKTYLKIFYKIYKKK